MKNDKGNGLVTVVPLSSKKLGKNIHPSNLDIGNELYSKVCAKYDTKLGQLAIQHNDLKKEIQRMKTGSIALIGQLTTISKIRIFDPQNSHDLLYGIRLDSTTLSRIDDKVKDMFIYQN